MGVPVALVVSAIIVIVGVAAGTEIVGGAERHLASSGRNGSSSSTSKGNTTQGSNVCWLTSESMYCEMTTSLLHLNSMQLDIHHCFGKA